MALAAAARLAGAQPARDELRPRTDEVFAAETDTPEIEVRIPRLRVDLLDLQAWIAVVKESEPRRWLAPLSFRDASGVLSPFHNPASPAIATTLHRRFVRMPSVQWSRRGLLVSRRGWLTIHPSLVIGRRLTAFPEICRGGRMIGLGVQIRIWLDEPPAAVVRATATPASPAQFLTAVRSMLDRR